VKLCINDTTSRADRQGCAQNKKSEALYQIDKQYSQNRPSTSTGRFHSHFNATQHIITDDLEAKYRGSPVGGSRFTSRGDIDTTSQQRHRQARRKLRKSSPGLLNVRSAPHTDWHRRMSPGVPRNGMLFTEATELQKKAPTPRSWKNTKGRPDGRRHRWPYQQLRTGGLSPAPGLPRKRPTRGYLHRSDHPRGVEVLRGCWTGPEDEWRRTPSRKLERATGWEPCQNSAGRHPEI
jgi:hypothetical protein